MKDDVTLREVMSREFVGVGESDPVAGAASLMDEEGATVAVVLRGSEPMGVLAARDVLSVVGADDRPDETPVADAMSAPPTTLGADEPLADAVAAMTDRDAGHVVVLERGDVVGTVDARDVVTATASLTGTLEPVTGPDSAAEGYVEDDTEFANQSICEVCGGLTPDLANVNGQLVCADCREF